MLVDFYNVEALALDRVLPSLCEKVLRAGERLLIVTGESELARLDALLWTYAPDSFLPHARRDGGDPETQPVLLSDTVQPLNKATNVMLADGLWRDEGLAFARTFYLFSRAQLEGARSTWRTLKDRAEVQARYWKQNEHGKWVQGP